jgi:alkylation response protein AidB-like acyl-CoA dehydrogenase
MTIHSWTENPMANNPIVNASEDEARALAEESRQTNWAGRSFVRELFLGNLQVDWVDPYPETPETPEFKEFYAKLQDFLEFEVDSAKIDQTGEYGEDVIQGLRDLGAFGIKIAKEYGGLGFNQAEYCKAIELIGGYDGSLVALISAHLSIGVPTPVKLFGTEEQKQKYLPRCARGAISAFALTEPDVGSDPARLATSYEKTPEGDFIITGEKLWITNGTCAELMVVMARDVETKKISTFIVETAWEGVSIPLRCHFMGLRALQNGVILFDHVKVPKENLIYREGAGLKVALITLNTGRLSLPAACIGGSRRAIEIAKDFSGRRVQWGAPVGKHEAISHKIADMAALTYAMESWCYLSNEMAMREGYDIRLEAATAKEWGSTRAWDIVDDLMQIRGGRGYETEASLEARGEHPIGVERMMRDSRINRIFEGSSEIMHLFMAREMVDKHLQVAGGFLDKKAGLGDKLKSLPGMLFFYALWYPKLWVPFGMFRYGEFGELAKYLRFAERSCRRLARNVFHAMVWHQAKLEKKQALLFRTVDIAMEIAVMVATVARTQKRIRENHENAEASTALTHLYCTNAQLYINERFRALWSNNDELKYKLGQRVLKGDYEWLESEYSCVKPNTRAQTIPCEEAAAK